MKLKKLTMLPLLAICLSGCNGSGVRHNPNEYCLDIPYENDFKILQLCDTHIANKDDRKYQFNYLTKLFTNEKAIGTDLIVITGDVFTFADRTTANEYFAFLDSFKVHWTLTFGNHDEQAYFSIEWLTGRLNELNNDPNSYCVFKDIQDDDVNGNANFAINLKDIDGSTKEQIIIMDSLRYNFGEYTGYDYMKQNQIDWYERLVDHTTVENGHVVDSLMFYHIPLPEFKDAWDYSQEHPEALLHGTNREGVSSPDKNIGFYDKIVEKGSTKGMFVAHDHVNDSCILYNGILFCYGVTSTNRIYYEEGLIGAKTITIHNDNSLTVEEFFETYEGC